jgi:hypothetical protein
MDVFYTPKKMGEILRNIFGVFFCVATWIYNLKVNMHPRFCKHEHFDLGFNLIHGCWWTYFAICFDILLSFKRILLTSIISIIWCYIYLLYGIVGLKMLVGMLLLKFTKMVMTITNFHITSSFVFLKKEKLCSPFYPIRWHVVESKNSKTLSSIHIFILFMLNWFVNMWKFYFMKSCTVPWVWDLCYFFLSW